MPQMVTNLKRAAILVRDGFTCAHCGCNLLDLPAAEVQLDHVLPKGGIDKAFGKGQWEADNLVSSCRKCNRAKSDSILPQIEIDRLKTLAAQPVKPLYATVKPIVNARPKNVDLHIFVHYSLNRAA